MNPLLKENPYFVDLVCHKMHLENIYPCSESPYSLTLFYDPVLIVYHSTPVCSNRETVSHVVYQVVGEGERREGEREGGERD